MTLSISVIIPTLNQGRFIERTIRSVLEQQYPNLDLIIIDGGSTDNTLGILRKYEGTLTWISERDNGQADAINKGLQRATGDIIAYLNSDDIYVPGALDRVARHFIDHPECMWLTGQCRIIDEHDREIRKPITAYKNLLLRRYSYSLLLVTNPISQPSTFWRRRVVEEIGLFSETEHMVMDYEYWLRVGKRHAPAVLENYLAAFRVYATAKTSTFFLKGFRRELELARQHSPSRILNALHCVSYLLIAGAYGLLAAKNRLMRKNPR